eukprot:TRINITY_DN67800_c0_g1_i1.p1 TRINITY_DN67800_c0_g1~~TRINITY_DN67800_c0_g1_i1.p1  ORF type:complete len:126 (+),score=18.73 TRINITY_DN67800_c0_g1_i1:84-461(+)
MASETKRSDRKQDEGQLHYVIVGCAMTMLMYLCTCDLVRGWLYLSLEQPVWFVFGGLSAAAGVRQSKEKARAKGRARVYVGVAVSLVNGLLSAALATFLNSSDLWTRVGICAAENLVALYAVQLM